MDPNVAKPQTAKVTMIRMKHEEAGGEILGEEYTPFRKTKDFGPYLARVKNSGADAVKLQIADFINSKEGEAFELIKDQTFLSNESSFDGFYIAKLKRT